MVLSIPDFSFECIATMTFSSAVMRLNRRMFWNVRAMPAEARRCGFIGVMSAPL
jgi:hypothetical protein